MECGVSRVTFTNSKSVIFCSDSNLSITSILNVLITHIIVLCLSLIAMCEKQVSSSYQLLSNSSKQLFLDRPLLSLLKCKVLCLKDFCLCLVQKNADTGDSLHKV